MPELIPAAPGILEIYYRVPMVREVHPFPLTPGSFLEIVPTPGYVIDIIKVHVSVVPDAPASAVCPRVA